MIIEGLPLAEILGDPSIDPRLGYTTQAGQPDWVRRQFFKAMGLDPDSGVQEAGSEYIVTSSPKPSKLVWS